MSILVFGKSGQLACELARDPEWGSRLLCLSRGECDLADPDACAAAIRRHAPRGVINAAAYTAVDRAESEADLAHTINAAAPGAMARTCADLGIPFLSVSSDYVFDGSGEHPRRRDAPTGPRNVYGRSKLAGERQIAAAGGAWAVLRTSWVVSAHGGNFLKTMLRLGQTRDHLRIVADQIGGPTPARDLAHACRVVLRALQGDPDKRGIYHFAGAPDVSWADFARAILAAAGMDVQVEDIPTTDYPTPAARPRNSRLDCSATEATFGIARPDWRRGVVDILNELGVKT